MNHLPCPTKSRNEFWEILQSLCEGSSLEELIKLEGFNCIKALIQLEPLFSGSDSQLLPDMKQA